MMFSTHARRYSAAIVATLALAACGGGGSDSPASSTAPTGTNATTTFPLAAAMVNFLKQAKATPFTVAGTGSRNGQVLEFTGSGSSVEVNSSGTFNGEAALVKKVTVTGTLGAQGINVPFTDAITQYFDSNYKPLGSSSPTIYCVSSAQMALPAMARIGDSGAYYATTCYTSSTKTTLLGTSVVTYSLVPGPETMAIFKLTSKSTTKAGVTTSITSNYVVSTNGILSQTESPFPGISPGGVTVDLVLRFQ